MPTNKPTKPSITLPSAFGTSSSNVKTPYTAQELIDGYSASIQQVLDGGNVNWMNDTFFKYMTYTTALCDWLNGTGTLKIPYVNSSNQLDYMDAPTGNIIGQVIALLCTADYIPNGCLPCDGQEYTKSVFEEFWTNYLTSSPVLLPVCSYSDYASDISSNGFCDKIAVDNINETFKVPTLNNNFYQGAKDLLRAKGNGKTLGLTDNHGSNYGLAYSASAGLIAQQPMYDKTLPSTLTTGNAPSGGVGLTTDSSKSGIVVENSDSNKEAEKIRYFIVVSNGQQNQAQMDWSAWASSLNNKANKNADNLSTAGKSLISGLGMPSSRYIDLTIGASLTSYTAPANGWFTIQYRCSGTGYFNCSLSNDTTQIKTGGSIYDQGTGYFSVPVKKGDIVSIYYQSNITPSNFRFIYSEGEPNV